MLSLSIRNESRGLTSSSVVSSTGLAISLLDGEAATKGTSESVVAAADGADVSGRGANAVELLRHLDVDGEGLGLCLGEAEYARDVVGNLEGSECCLGIAGLVHVALEGAGAVGVDLVDGDGED